MAKKPKKRTVTAAEIVERPKCELTPWGNRVIVEVEGQQQMTSGGIALPDRLQDDGDMMIGEIVAVGEGPMHDGEAMQYDGPSVGYRIKFHVAQSHEIEHDGRKFRILSVPSILCVLPAR